MVHIENLNYVNHLIMCLFESEAVTWDQTVTPRMCLIFKFLKKVTHTIAFGL